MNTSTETASRPKYRIWAKPAGLEREEVDTADSWAEAKQMLADYRMAYRHNNCEVYARRYRRTKAEMAEVQA